MFIDYFGASHVGITPNSSKADRINAARVLIPRIEFNSERCTKGLDALRSWSFEYDEEKKTFSSEPLHDWASHDGDGFSYGCLIAQLADPPPPPPEPPRGIHVGQTSVTLEELWKTVQKGKDRL